MATQPFSDFNRAGRSLQALRTLAQTEPQSAQAYLTAVRDAAVSAAPNDPVIAALSRIVSAGDVFAALQTEPNLGQLFPDTDQSANWGSLQAARASTIGWSASGPQTQQVVSGVLSRADGKFTLTTDSGRTLNLVQGTQANTGQYSMNASWALGFGDGPMTFRGTFDSAGNFAINSGAPGIHQDFVWDRVVTSPGATPTTGSGQPITNTALLEQLKALPRLGIVLTPGADGRKWWLEADAPAPDFYALGGRWEQTPATNTTASSPLVESRDGKAIAIGQFAWSAFRRTQNEQGQNIGGEVEFPAEYQAGGAKVGRLAHGDRAWVLGHFNTDNLTRDGIPTKLVAQETWGTIDQTTLAYGESPADPLTQAALSVDLP
jgi:hypothetical protein